VRSPEPPLRVAIVGAGPAGFYAAAELLERAPLDVEVEMFERLPTPWGLVRGGVAPDHPETKAITSIFQRISAHPSFRYHLNVEVGVHVTPEELLEHHHAVIYAYGASGDRKLGIPGESLLGSHAATEFVAWYNGHPDFADREFDLSSRRVVVIGNGNVALDIARILLLDPQRLAQTDIADHAWEALRDSAVEEVVLMGRRGPAQAAFTSPELLALGDLPDVNIVVEPEPMLDQGVTSSRSANRVEAFSASLKQQLISEYAADASAGRSKRLVLQFLSSPVEILGTDRVEAVRFVRNELVSHADQSVTASPTGYLDTIDTGLVLRSVGYRGMPLPGLPFDEGTATITNDAGRVVDAQSGTAIRGAYTAGWIKRGASGVIGTNKKCASQTVRLLVDDYLEGRLSDPARGWETLALILARRQPQVVGYRGWKAIDLHERRRGQSQGRPRVKLVRADDMLRVTETAVN
jgi:ferredoxin--NADP+ reductase